MSMNKGEQQVYLTERKISTLSRPCFYYYLLCTESSANKNALFVISSNIQNTKANNNLHILHQEEGL